MKTGIQDVLDDATVTRLREVIGDQTGAVVAVATPEGDMVWASAPGSAELFGRQQSDFEQHSQFEYLHPDDHGLFRRKLERARRGETVRYVVRARAADGSWVRVSSVAWAVTTTDGKRIVSIAVPVDTET